MNDRQALTEGAHHVGLTVPHLEETRRFFVDVLGYQQVGEIADYPAVFVSDGDIMITLWQAADPEAAVAFDRHNVVGLHHLALKIGSHAALDDLYAALQQIDNVRIEFAPEPLGSGGARHMMTYIPGGIRVEFLAPAA